MNLNPARKVGESFTAYKRRRAAENVMVKRYLANPKMLFQSTKHYVDTVDGKEQLMKKTAIFRRPKQHNQQRT